MVWQYDINLWDGMTLLGTLDIVHDIRKYTFVPAYNRRPTIPTNCTNLPDAQRCIEVLYRMNALYETN